MCTTQKVKNILKKIKFCYAENNEIQAFLFAHFTVDRQDG